MFNPSINTIRISGIVVSIILACLPLYKVIARDSILYIQTAQEFLNSGLSGAISVYRWPFYSIIFAWIHNISGIPLEISARILNAILFAILVDAFFRLYHETFPNSRVKWVAMLVILAFTGLNNYRFETLREWGFLAFSLLSFVYLLRTYKFPSVSDSLYWQLCIVLAFLFRPEAIAFMVFGSAILLFRNDTVFIRLRNFAIANVIFLILMGVLTAIVLYFDIGVNKLGRIDEAISYLNFMKSAEIISQTSKKIEDYIIPYHGSDYALTFLVAGILGILVFKILAKIGILYSIVLLYGYCRTPTAESRNYSSIVAYLTILAFFVVYIFVIHYMVVAGRHILLTATLSLIFVSYILEKPLIYCFDNRKTGLLLCFLILITVNLLTGLIHTSNSKKYLKLLGEWTSLNISKSAKLISNDTRLYYYSGRKSPFELLYRESVAPGFIMTPEVSSEYDYLMLKRKSVNSAPNEAVDSRSFKKLKQFCNAKGDCAMLYEIKN